MSAPTIHRTVSADRTIRVHGAIYYHEQWLPGQTVVAEIVSRPQTGCPILVVHQTATDPTAQTSPATASALVPPVCLCGHATPAPVPGCGTSGSSCLKAEQRRMRHISVADDIQRLQRSFDHAPLACPKDIVPQLPHDSQTTSSSRNNHAFSAVNRAYASLQRLGRQLILALGHLQKRHMPCHACHTSTDACSGDIQYLPPEQIEIANAKRHLACLRRKQRLALAGKINSDRN